MKKISNRSIFFIIILLIALCISVLYIYSNDKQKGTIEVEGIGYATAVPDIAELYIGVETEDMQLTVAQNEAADVMSSVFKVLNKNKISESDIQTINYSISPIWVWNPDKEVSEFKGYKVKNDIKVKIREIEKIGNVIDDVVVAGGNNIRINGINFTIEDFNIYLDEARENAVINAENKARMLADKTDVDLGSPIRITVKENIPDIRAKSLAFRGSIESTPISAGEMSVSVSVRILYEIL
ncbi:MAG: DUF541 domain-containing protein [Candidatus Methanoliparum thermophilum]|uniref:DUF541 domain-containing protein n=1 Tax=Methanoliparum thermophilum TaxID=2491083 RepID=A0A520KTL3_METT2|nr:SIMPL domain-containing protein [Candidatus Methanoliparum sp. LAM-1]RZN64905.1 MAG: DUF541 domain-containing protein [Candidatus Methanoliparum thermophilum]BDC36219.1 hypothetical protein MTLP_09010 [Candidatus Methanoliparum sp. LAM-1]